MSIVLIFGISPWWMLLSGGIYYVWYVLEWVCKSVWYFIEWLIELFHYGTTAYRTNTFEREAHANDDNLTYLANRPVWGFWEYV